jgi:hypothetical protein
MTPTRLAIVALAGIVQAGCGAARSNGRAERSTSAADAAGVAASAAATPAPGWVRAWLFRRARRSADWIVRGLATLAGLVTSAWLTPWSPSGFLALAAIAPSRRLRIARLAFCADVIATRVATHPF